MLQLLTIKDAIIVPLILLIAYLVSTRIKNKHIKEEPYYKYFRTGLFVKLFAGLAFAGIYIFYYGGGDTMYYFLGSGNIVKMWGKHIPTFFKLLLGNHSAEVYSMFDVSTGWPTYWRDPNSFAVCRFNVPFYIVSFGSYLGNTLIMDLFLYLGIWQFFKMVNSLYPNRAKWLAIALLFFPSVVFWSSGILKDGWTYVGVLLVFVYSHRIFILKDAVLKNLLYLIFWALLIIAIRPFIFYVAIGAALIWIGFYYIKTIKGRFLRTIALPLVALVLWLTGSFILAQTSSMAGDKYSSIDALLETAFIIQDDLKRDYYGGNSFDIGGFETTIPGVLEKAPSAILAGIFRPFIWEGEGIMMKFSGLENLILLLFFIYILFKRNPLKTISKIYNDPFLLASFIFSLTYAFIVGLTTANFGALVRYRIPSVALILILFIIVYNSKIADKNENLNQFI